MKVIQQFMNVERHIQTLERQHDSLDFEISLQVKDYGNETLIQTLKKKKLKLKDEIELIKSKMLVKE